MTRHATLSCLVVALVFAVPVAGDPLVDALFDTTRLHEVEITMAASDWSKLRATYQENTNYDATVTIDGERVENSSIRSRGSGTRNGVKPGLRVDFGRKIKTQTFRGFKVLVLDNMYNDPSFVREQLAFSIFREMGILVPRESFARLTVNGEYWGLYAIVEPIDQIFVRNHVDSGNGNLFEYNVPPPTDPDAPAWDFTLSRGQTAGDYIPSPFEPKTNEDDLDGSALLDFIRTVSEGPAETFVEDISAFIDPHALLTYYAVEVATAEVDGLTSFFGINNFYLYQPDGTRRFLFIPWDHDFNFTRANHDILFGIDRNRLMSRLLSDPGLRAFYRTTLESIMNRYLNPSWVNPRMDAMLSLIHNAVLADTKRRGGAENPTASMTYDEATAHVRNVVAERGAHVSVQLRAGRRRSTAH